MSSNNKGPSYTQVCTLLHAAMDVVDDVGWKDRILKEDEQIRANAKNIGKDIERVRATTIARNLSMFFIQGGVVVDVDHWDLDEQMMRQIQLNSRFTVKAMTITEIEIETRLCLKLMECVHKGHRYWVSGPNAIVDRATRNVIAFRWKFWSDHKKRDFYHGHYTSEELDERQLAIQFVAWLPFEVPPEVLKRAQGAARMSWEKKMNQAVNATVAIVGRGGAVKMARWVRQGKKITRLRQPELKDKEGKVIMEAVPKEEKMCRSINEAKRESRKIQMREDKALGLGTVRVKEHKHKAKTKRHVRRRFTELTA